MTKKIVIVEDEPIIAADLCMMIERMKYTVLGSFDRGEEALPFILDQSPDLVLLDIELADAMNGIALVQAMEIETSVPFIFITSFSDEDSISRVRPLKPAAYLVKPIQERTLAVNVELALYKTRHGLATRPFSMPANQTRIFVKTDTELIGIPVEEIIYIEAYDNYAFVFTATQRYLLTHTLKSVEAKLIDQGFLRIHKSYIVNLLLVTSVRDSTVLVDNNKIPLGRSYRKLLFAALTIL